MSLQKLRHVILTRYNLGLYDRPDAEEWMAERMPLFERTRESVLSQEGDFEWHLCLDPLTPNRWRQAIICDSRMAIKHDHPKFFRSEGWTITTRLDNDDIYLPGAVKAIQAKAKEEEMIIDLRYNQLYKGELWSSGREVDGWERQQPNSPFLSLVENGAKRTCYARPHTKMIEEYRGKFASNKVLAYMVIHDNNLGNKIVGRKI